MLVGFTAAFMVAFIGSIVGLLAGKPPSGLMAPVFEVFSFTRIAFDEQVSLPALVAPRYIANSDLKNNSVPYPGRSWRCVVIVQCMKSV